MIKLVQLNLGKQYGGAEKHIEDIIKYIDKQRFEVLIICRKNTKFEECINKIALEFSHIQVFSVEVNKSRILKFIKEIKHYIALNKVDVIHAHGITSSIIGNITKARNCKLITTVHGYSDLDRMDKGKLIKYMFNKLEKISCRASDMCIAVSNDIKKYLIIKGVRPESIKVVHHGVPLKDNNINVNKKLNNSITITSLGRLEKVKGYDTLIKAIYYCVSKGNENIKCKIAGFGSEKEKLQNLIDELNLDNKCKLMGFVEDKNIVLQESDIYVQPSLIESFGISIIEAMQYNIPVIGTDSGGIKEIIDNEITGLLFNKEDYEDLGEKIIYLLNNKEERISLGKNGAEKVKKEFVIEDKIKDIEKIINEVI